MQIDLQEIEQQAPAEPKRVPFAAVSETKHILVPGVYAKATFVRQNVKFYTKKSPVDHMSILAHGEILVDDGVKKTHLRAPAQYTIPADTRVVCYSLVDSVFYCIHATNETDIDKLSQIY